MAKFAIGNKDAEKWTEEEAVKLFLTIRDFAMKDDVNSLQDAILRAGYFSSGFYYLLDKFPVLEPIKKDCQDILIAGVNQKALEGNFNATASIWRMKQCGEKDESAINHQNNGASFEPPVIRFKNSG